MKAPTRGAFGEFVDSDMQFSVSGTAKKIDPEGIIGPYHASLVEGEGWDSFEGDDKKKGKDTEHDVFLASLKWSGNLMFQTNNLVFAKGKNDLGRLISVGWMRPGNRVTLGRRYLGDEDGRAKWEMKELTNAVLDGILKKDEGMRIPPWQCPVLHANEKESKNKKRKFEESNRDNQKGDDE